jgi:hypothetical protein
MRTSKTSADPAWRKPLLDAVPMKREGRVEEVMVRPGDRVEAGTRLLRIQSTGGGQTRAEAELASARLEGAPRAGRHPHRPGAPAQPGGPQRLQQPGPPPGVQQPGLRQGLPGVLRPGLPIRPGLRLPKGGKPPPKEVR